jgi:hypothetical protein
MNTRPKIVFAVWLCSFLIIGLLVPNLFSVIPSGTTAARGLQSGGQGNFEQLSAQRLAVREMTRTLFELNTRYQIAGKAERKHLLDNLREVAASRQEMLTGLMETDPGEVLRVALPSEMRDNIPFAIRDKVEQHVDVEGELEVIYKDSEDASRLLYFLNVAGERLSLHFASDVPTNLLSGAAVRVKGVRVGNEVALLESGKESLKASSSNGFETMAMAVAPNTFGEQKVLVLLVNFQDKQTQPWTVEQVRSIVFTSVNNFYKEMSYQQTWLTGDVYGWFTLPINSGDCAGDQIATYAKQAATAAGVNLSAYNRFVYAFPSMSCNGYIGWANIGGNPSQAWINGVFTLKNVGHELGHNFGLCHSRSMDCGASVVGSGCSVTEYGDTLDIMGNPSVTAHSHAYQKERLGWLNYGTSPGITTVQGSGTYWLDPYESVGANAKALKILKSTDSYGRKTSYYIEFRRPVGFDSFISSNSNVMNGVVVHLNAEYSAAEDYLLDMTPETTSWSDAALVVGRSYNDPNVSVTITPLSVDSTGAAINVSFGPQPCVRANPSMVLSPSTSQWVSAGSTVTCTVSVSNNDSGGCTASSFNLQANVPSGWSAVFANPSSSLSPGASTTTTLQITSPASATDGFYTVGVSASNSSDAAYSVSSSTTCVIATSLGVAVSSDRSSYTRTQTAIARAIVTSGGSPVSGASVTFTMTKSNGSVVTGIATTGTDGSAVFSYRFNKKRDPAGTYTVSANANLNGVSGSNTTSFGVQ